MAAKRQADEQKCGQKSIDGAGAVTRTAHPKVHRLLSGQCPLLEGPLTCHYPFETRSTAFRTLMGYNPK